MNPLRRMYIHWHRFWFEKRSPIPIVLFRICIGLILLDTLVNQIGGQGARFYGPNAIVPAQDVIAYYWNHQLRYDVLQVMPPTNESVTLLLAVLSIAAAGVAVGLFTRLNALIIFMGLLSLHNQCHLWEDGGDDLLRMSSLMLAFSSAGAMLSVDALLRKRLLNINEPTDREVWPQRLLQLQMCVMYWHTFMAKIQGVDWLHGDAVYLSTRIDSYMRLPVPPFLDFPAAYSLLTYGALGVEFCLFTLIWYRPLRYYILTAGLLLHLGIEWCMNIPGFEWTTLSFYLLFIRPEDYSRLWIGLNKRLPFLKSCCSSKNLHSSESDDTAQIASLATANRIWLAWLATGSAMFCIPLMISANKIRSIENKPRIDYGTALQQEMPGNFDDAGLERYADIQFAKKDLTQAQTAYSACTTRELQKADRERIMQKLACVYREEDRLDESLKIYQGLFDEEQSSTNNPATLAKDLNNIGLTQYFIAIASTDRVAKDRIFNDALRSFNQASEIESKLGAADANLKATTLHNVFYLLRDMGNAAAARQAREDAISMDRMLNHAIEAPY